MSGTALLSEDEVLEYDLVKGSQPTLDTFFKYTYIYMWCEGLNLAVLWVVQMFVFKFALETSIGAPYRLANALLLLHMGTPLAMLNVIQQIRNNNSVFHWIFVVFLMGFASDLESLMEVASRNLSDQVPWAWRFYLATAVINALLTSFAIFWYTYWFVYKKPRDIPKPFADVMYVRALNGFYLVPNEETPLRIPLKKHSKNKRK